MGPVSSSTPYRSEGPARVVLLAWGHLVPLFLPRALPHALQLQPFEEARPAIEWSGRVVTINHPCPTPAVQGAERAHRWPRVALPALMASPAASHPHAFLALFSPWP